MTPQRTPEWMAARRGIPTASRFDQIITAARGDPSTSQTKLIDELLAESLLPPSGEPERMTADMHNGVILEGEARCAYELEFAAGLKVQDVGLIMHPSGLFGGSPDCLVGSDGGAEIKCPTPAVHIRYVRNGILPLDHKAQVHGYMVVTGRPFWDFYSHCRGLQPFRLRVPRDDFTKKLEAEVLRFCAAYNEARLKFGLKALGVTP